MVTCMYIRRICSTPVWVCVIFLNISEDFCAYVCLCPSLCTCSEIWKIKFLLVMYIENSIFKYLTSVSCFVFPLESDALTTTFRFHRQNHLAVDKLSSSDGCFLWFVQQTASTLFHLFRSLWIMTGFDSMHNSSNSCSSHAISTNWAQSDWWYPH